MLGEILVFKSQHITLIVIVRAVCIVTTTFASFTSQAIYVDLIICCVSIC